MPNTRGMTSWRRRQASIGAAVVVGSLMSMAAAAPAAAPSCGSHDGPWTRLPEPRYAGGVQGTSGFAVHDGIVLVTNGTLLLRLELRTCRWQEVFRAAEGEVVSAVRVTEDGGRFTGYLAVAAAATPAGVLPAVAVRRSTDAGRTWPATGEVAGSYAGFAASGRSLYALTTRPADLAVPEVGSVGVRAVQALSRSDDGGATWSQRQLGGPAVQTPGAAARLGTHFAELMVDPADTDHVWLWGPDGLHETRDGAATAPVKASGFAGGLHVTDGVVARRGGRSGKVAQVAFAADLPVSLVAYTPNAGRTDQLAALAVPGGVGATTSGHRPGEFAVVSAGRVLVHPTDATPATPFLDVTPERTRPTELRTDAAAPGFTVYGLAGNTVVHRVMPASARTPVRAAPGKAPARGPDQNATLTLDVTRYGGMAPRISPEQLTVALGPGERRTIAYELGLPGTRKVDIYFLVDASNSMADKIRGLKLAMNRIVNALSKANVDAWFGVGFYQSYTEGAAYERVRDIAPPGPDLLDAFSRIYATGGGSETALAALYQVATGKGQDDGSHFIAAGQQANFRPDALRVVVHAGDEGITPGPPQPTYEEVGAALRSVDALQVGIAYESAANDQKEFLSNPQYTPHPSAGQAVVATESGAFAPAEGADCDGDGSPDLLPGAPLVCIVDPERAEDAAAIAPAIVNMVLAVPDLQPVSVTWNAPQPVVEAVVPKEAPSVNLRFPALLRFRVVYTCPASLAGQVYPTRLTARVRGTAVATAAAAVECAAPAAIVPVAPALGVAIGTAPAPPVEPVGNAQPQAQGQPQAQSQSQSQTQSQAQGQLGTAYQEQEEVEAAFAWANPQQAGERALSFSRYRPVPDDETGPGPVLPLAAGLTAAAALAVVRTRLSRTAPAAVARRRTTR